MKPDASTDKNQIAAMVGRKKPREQALADFKQRKREVRES
jgi:hypothetical protein